MVPLLQKFGHRVPRPQLDAVLVHLAQLQSETLSLATCPGLSHQSATAGSGESHGATFPGNVAALLFRTECPPGHRPSFPTSTPEFRDYGLGFRDQGLGFGV